MDTHLGYTKHDTKNKQTENSRNGHSSKTVESDLGTIDLEIPRDRQSEFDPILVKKHQRRMPCIEEQVIALYARGVSTRDIGAHLHQIYGMEISPTLESGRIARYSWSMRSSFSMPFTTKSGKMVMYKTKQPTWWLASILTDKKMCWGCGLASTNLQSFGLAC